MMTGVLEITGRIDLAQFWASGESDADTVQVTLSPADGAFTFRASAAAPARVTNAFKNARFRDKKDAKGHPTYKMVIRKGAITIRLQGIDAPELHFIPRVKGGHNFRQFLGESSTLALAGRLKRGAKQSLPCRVVTAVDHPNDAVDVYGRFVGDILLPTSSGTELNINTWLAEQGWAFPTFYDTMTPAEIDVIVNATSFPQAKKMGVWGMYLKKIGPLDRKLLYRKGGPPAPARDHGPVIFPKLFRRLCAYSVKLDTKKFNGTLLAYLRTQKADKCYRMNDFLKNPERKPNARLAQFVNSTDQFLSTPGGLVYSEKPATIVDVKLRPIKRW
ncbi:MAG TPA: thermonuclease family protein [Gemmatimonadaceae bacterium]